MSKDKWLVPRTKTYPDPRLAIAKHLGWTKTLTGITDYRLPEPDNYNYAVFNRNPWECSFIADQVFYYDKKMRGWWTVYYVPEEQKQEFLTWAEPLPFEICWAVQRQTKLRTPRPWLWTRTCAVEQTTEERLYTMGYFDKLQSTYNIDISTTLGTPRLDMPQGEYS
jgi:hypothetical protein